MSAASSGAPRLASYRTETPAWETVLDVDALAAAEGKSWVYQGMMPAARGTALPGQPLRRRPRRQCRARVRPARAPLRRGRLRAARGKQNVAWEDENTILVARDWGPGTMTASGYPFVDQAAAARPEARPGGGSLSRQGRATSASAPMVLRDSDGRVHGVGAYRGVDFFHSRVHPVPARRQRHPADPAARLARRASSTAGCWSRSTSPGTRAPGCASPPIRSSPTTSPNGSAIPLRARPSLVWAPGPRQTLSGIATTQGKLIVTILDNVRGRAFAMDYAGGALAHDRDRACRATRRSASPPPPTRTSRRCSASPTI